MAELTLHGIAKSYGRSLAVSGIDLTVGSGELVCLLGPSGSGKSTLLRLIGGFETPSAGRIEIDGEDVTRMAPERRPTAMVFQSHALWPHMSVHQNIAFGLKLRRLARHEVEARVNRALDLVGLKGFGARRPQHLSGGQQQRVAIARCIVLEPKILLLDEPFASLDQHLREHLREEVRAIQRNLGITTVFVTHGQDEALAIADRIAVMSMGRINQVGHPTEIYERPEDAFVAGFIGAMNMVAGTVADGRFRGGGFVLPVALPDGAATLAVRPERLVPQADADGPWRVVRAVHFGAYRIVEAAGEGGLRMKLHLPADGSLAAGERLRLAPAAAAVFMEGHPVIRIEARP